MPDTLSPRNGVPSVNPEFTSEAKESFRDVGLRSGNTINGLQTLRLKLLDSTNRNRLINYTHPKASVRFIDEIPELVYRELIDDKAFKIEGIEEPVDDIVTEEQGRKLKSLKGHERSIYLAEHFHGLNSSFDLPEIQPEQSREERHTDDTLRALYDPETLESRLRSIAQTANLAIEESGSNFLHLAIGFLEWYEADSSNKAIFAPLILVPVEMVRTLTRGKYVFSIKTCEEEPMHNFSLVEKLRKDFGLELPPLEEDTDLTSYLQECGAVVKDFKRWRVRRQMSLGLFQFQKILIFKDLDPDQWPEEQSLDSNHQVQMFFEAQTNSMPEGEGIDYKIDNHAQEDMPLIDDADSTQHSALIDALDGKNLIIEGPPGTGKSQTITNLIAAAMGQGKSVLFVAEKLAALRVVKDRLTTAGLGDFCLELHSDKVKKTEILDAIQRRLNARYPSALTLDKSLSDLKAHRRELQLLVAALNRSCGETGMTNQRMLTEAVKYRIQAKAALSTAPESFDALRYPNPVEYPWPERDELLRMLSLLGDYLERLKVEGHVPANSPWRGLGMSPKVGDELQIIHALRDFINATEHLLFEISEANRHFDSDLPPFLRELEFAGAMVALFDDARSRLCLPYLSGLASTTSNAYRSFLTALEEVRMTESQFREKLGEGFDVRVSGTRIISSIRKILELGLSESTSVTQLLRMAKLAEKGVAAIVHMAPTLDNLSNTFSLSLQPNRTGLECFQKIIQICLSTPLEDLSHRAPRLFKGGCRFLYEKAASVSTALSQDLNYIERVFHIEFLPERRVIGEIALALGATSRFSFFSSDWRKSKKLYRAISIDKKKKFDALEASSDLNILLHYLKLKEELESDSILRQELGEQFDGSRTNFAALARVAAWFELIVYNFPINDGAPAIHLKFAEVEGSLLQKVAGLSDTDSANVLDQLREGFKDSPELDQHLLTKNIGWDGFARTLGHFAETVMDLTPEPVLSEFTVGKLASIKNELSNVLESVRSLDEVSLGKSLGEHFCGSRTDPVPLRATLDLFETASKIPAPKLILEKLLRAKSLEHLDENLSRLRKIAQRVSIYKESAVRFTDFGAVDINLWSGSTIDDVSAVSKAATFSMTAARSLGVSLTLAAHILRCREVGLAPLLDLILVGKLDCKRSNVVLDHCIFGPIAKRIKNSNPSLECTGSMLSQTRRAYSEGDQGLQTHVRKGLAAKIGSITIPSGINSARVSDKTELALINHLLPQQRPRVTVRALCSRSGLALRAMKPCFMMGPLAVAQFLDRRAPKFDIVIMDEASQMRPEDALGAIARGKQIVIVGDPKQLPPTSFFDRADGDERSEEDTVLHVADSILDAAVGLMPMRQLKWHYRSRHEKLIAFSNKHFYDSKLVVFPSPHGNHSDYGVNFHKVNGICSSSKNEVEALAVAEALLTHLRSRPHESVGVVAMNIQQTKLIEELFFKLLKQQPELQQALEKKIHEPFFIKNLENVQGDERDVIIISTTYGPDATGAVHRRFGPINFSTGWRRLNVLFTRAKSRIHVFASMTADDIVLEDSAPRGARALKAYLHYAKTGLLTDDEGREGQDRQFDSPFEEEVARSLEIKGFECVPQMGVAGYKIDLAVRHPDRRGSYILGIECDGAAYHTCQASRDRDRLRQQVLERLGWNIHRIWSTDWFANPDHEIEGILKQIEKLR